MWTVVSARWSAALRSQRLRLDACCGTALSKAWPLLFHTTPEARRALPGLITRFARQIARFSAHLTSGSVDVLVAMGQIKVAGLFGRSGLINQQCLATGHEEWDRTNISWN